MNPISIDEEIKTLAFPPWASRRVFEELRPLENLDLTTVDNDKLLVCWPDMAFVFNLLVRSYDHWAHLIATSQKSLLVFPDYLIHDTYGVNEIIGMKDHKPRRHFKFDKRAIFCAWRDACFVRDTSRIRVPYVCMDDLKAINSIRWLDVTDHQLTGLIVTPLAVKVPEHLMPSERRSRLRQDRDHHQDSNH